MQRMIVISKRAIRGPIKKNPIGGSVGGNIKNINAKNPEKIKLIKYLRIVA